MKNMCCIYVKWTISFFLVCEYFNLRFVSVSVSVCMFSMFGGWQIYFYWVSGKNHFTFMLSSSINNLMLPIQFAYVVCVVLHHRRCTRAPKYRYREHGAPHIQFHRMWCSFSSAQRSARVCVCVWWCVCTRMMSCHFKWANTMLIFGISFGMVWLAVHSTSTRKVSKSRSLLQ